MSPGRVGSRLGSRGDIPWQILRYASRMEWTPDRIRRFRAAGLSLSQPQFAKELGFAPRTIGNAERGTHPPSLALRRALDHALEHASEVQRNRFRALSAAAVQENSGGSHPSGWAPVVHCEALSRRLGRTVTLDEAGLAVQLLSACAALDWRVDTLIALTDLGKVDVDMERRRVLAATTYSVVALAVPGEPWWTQMAALGTTRTTRTTASARCVGFGDLEAVREMASIFSRVDQRRGGGHARSALVQYLTSDVASYLRGSYPDERVRKDMFSAASELAYLAGWMAFDNAEHSIAQYYFSVAVKLAAEADDPPMAGHVFRAMAHQAIDLGHFHQGLDLAAASMDGNRYLLASPRERALFGVVYARALGAAGQAPAAAEALIKAEDDLSSAAAGDDEPSRVFFFGEASLAHQTALTLRATGDLSGALTEFSRSVRTRKAATFTRTHALTLGHLGAVQARRGEIDQACSTWSTALDAMDGIRSGRTRQAVVDMRAALSAFRHRGIPATAELDARACAYLSTGSP